MQYSIKKAFKFIKPSDIGHCFLFIVVLPFALIAKLFIRDFWLVCEDKNEARDNGYHFFKWVRKTRPKQKIAYAINKKSPDYPKVKNLGKVISYGSPSHWFWYIVADKNVSSQKGGKPNAAVCYLLEVVLGLRKNNRVFLQHGITKDSAEWLFYKNTKMRLFVTAAAPEQEFVSANFGYPAENVKLLGFCRYDALAYAERDENLILVMPTWRNWLGRESLDNRDLDFTQTEYFKLWDAFLRDERLHALLASYGKRLVFYSHRNMQKFINYFSSDSPLIEIADWREYDVQDLLKRAALMITDYSSVFFDFAYMRKPVIFYQFDEAEFREKQYQLGFFDYHDTVLGEWTDNRDELITLLEKQLESGIPLLSEETIRAFFPSRDENNCKRTYDAIKDL